MLTAATLWEKTLTELRNILTEVTVMNVFGQSRGVSLVDNTLTVEVSEGRPAEEIQQQWGQIILATLMKVGAPEGISAIFKEPPKEQAAQGVPEVQRDSREGSGLMEKFTFDAFVEGPSNQFPLAMAKYVAQHPGDENSHTNPLFMYGPTGVGKTHLLHAIGNLGIKVKPGLTVLYTTCERLLDDYLGMWNTEERKAAFHQKYRTPDMLLVDDIQFLSGKQGLQNEFFTIFNELTDSQKQIVMTSDRAPKDIPDLMDRLMSRFQSGVCADVDMPAYETRLNILRVKLREYGTVELSDEVLDFMAKHVSSSVRSLEGALSIVVNYARIFPANSRQLITVDVLEKSLLKDLISQQETMTKLSCGDIIGAVCKHFNVRQEDIIGPGKMREVVFPRQVAIFLCRKLTTSSTLDIGRAFSRNHSTILHNCATIQGLYKSNDHGTVESLHTIVSALGRSFSDLA